MSKKKNQKKNPPTEKSATVEESETITESTEPETSAEPEPVASEDTPKKKSPKKKIDFVFCDKCGFQSTELDTKSCPTCKNDLTPAYSSNPNS